MKLVSEPDTCVPFFFAPRPDEVEVESKYSHGQELFYKFISKITNKLVKQLLYMTVCTQPSI